MNDRRSVSRALFLAPLFGGLLVVSTAVAQDQFSCSASEVDDALSGLECVADGVYIAPETVVDALAERCGEALTERGCRRCFKKGRGKIVGAFKALAKLRLIDRSVAADIKDALNESEDEVCSDPGEDIPAEDEDDAPPPNSENPPAPENPGSGEQLPDRFSFDPQFPNFNWGGGGR